MSDETEKPKTRKKRHSIQTVDCRWYRHRRSAWRYHPEYGRWSSGWTDSRYGCGYRDITKEQKVKELTRQLFSQRKPNRPYPP